MHMHYIHAYAFIYISYAFIYISYAFIYIFIQHTCIVSLYTVLDIGTEVLKHFCKSFAKDCKIKLDDLRDDVPDEVINVDVSKIKKISLTMHGLKSKEEVFRAQLLYICICIFY